MKKIILSIVVLAILIGGYIFYQHNLTKISSIEYYQNLRKECEQKDSKSCCLASVDRMEEIGAYVVNDYNGVCDYGYKKETLKCLDSFAWCEKQSIKPINEPNLTSNKKEIIKKIKKDFNNLFPALDNEGNPCESCAKNFFQKIDFLNKNTAIVFYESHYNCEIAEVDISSSKFKVIKTKINNNCDLSTTNFKKNSENSQNHNTVKTCTGEAKSCGNGTFVGRTGPNCEFAKCPGKPLKPDFISTKENSIQLPNNVITEKECTAVGGEVWNTLGKTSYEGELIGRIDGLRCPCACLIKSDQDILWVNVDGNMEEFVEDLAEIQTFDDCKKAGFKIKDEEPEICIVGEPHMTGGKYKTFYNNPIEAGKTCEDYHYSTCPGSCIAKCISSSCSEPDENGAVACTSDCDGVGSCVSKEYE